VAAILTSRSVLRAEEGDVTTAIVAGGIVVLIALARGGHGAAFATAAGVFAGAELAALGRRLGVDHDAPAAPEVTATAATIGVGLAAGVVVAAIASIRASAPVANVALATVILLGLALLAARAWRAASTTTPPR
jgi:hypothetical protein